MDFSGQAGFHLAELQSDQVELKLDESVEVRSDAKASIGPGGIEIAKHPWHGANDFELQSDQVELKWPHAAVLHQPDGRFNRTRWN